MTHREFLVRDLMQAEVVTLDASDTLDLADDIMRLGRIRHMPVLADGRLVGMLSQRDLFRAAVSSVLQFKVADERQWLATVQVQDVMTKEVFTTHPEMKISDAVRLMLQRKIGCLPVVADGKLVGLLSETDCLRLLDRFLLGTESSDEGTSR